MPTGIRCSIYLRNEKEHEDLKRAAEDEGRSVSNYLIWLHEVYTGKAGKLRDRSLKKLCNE